MQIIEGNALADLCDYSFGDHHTLWNKGLTGTFKYANANNEEFLKKAKQFEGRIMTLFIDNIRLYPRAVPIGDERDVHFLNYLLTTNNLLALCSLLPANGFIIFTSHEDTPIDENIRIPFNVEKIYAVNALYNNDKIVPIPIGLQRKMNPDDNRLDIMQDLVHQDLSVKPNKLLYINCGIGRNEERKPLATFETNDWCTTRFDKDSKFFPHAEYDKFLNELINHKFVVCPKGHGYDTHRIWETLYMRRVPIMIRNPYFERLLKDFPVIFVDSWADITHQFLVSIYAQEFYEAATNIDLSKLDLNLIFNKLTNKI